MVVTLLALQIDERLGARAARLVDGRDGYRRHVVLRDDALHQAHGLVGAAALAGHHDELDGLLGLPLGRCRRRHPHGDGDAGAKREASY